MSKLTRLKPDFLYLDEERLRVSGWMTLRERLELD